jgi:AcrR family transcriptional regulator
MATNAERTAFTRARLIDTARALFAEHGYAATGTEAILEGAGVRRGAMYHHFADKAALFEAVCLQLCEEAVPAIEAATEGVDDPLEALVQGSLAWLRFVTQPGVQRIWLLDAPTVLGWARWEALDRRLGQQSLREGIEAARAQGALRYEGSPELLATMLNGALNALALRLAAPGPRVPRRDWEGAVRALLETLRARPTAPRRRSGG